MDETPEYIGMCRKAGEIQGVWVPELGDQFSYVKSYGSKKIGECGIISFIAIHPKHPKEIYITDPTNPASGCGIHRLAWLPRQDQLQRIFLDFAAKEAPQNIQTIPSTLLLMHFLSEYYTDWPDDIWPYDLKDVSMEQLWLNLVMGLIAEKAWNGDGWNSERGQWGREDE
jgi:hypothetical protein